MMRRFSTPVELRWIPILLMAVLAIATGCASTDQPVEESDEAGMDSEFSDAAQSRTPTPESQVRDTQASNALRDLDVAPVYFAFDSYEIRSEYEPVLRTAARAIQESGANVVIEGHTDERGSDEYNLALGERRAAAVRKYLYNLGVPMSQMSIVSYGEAQPAVSGSGERVWQLNRRAELVVR